MSYRRRFQRGELRDDGALSPRRNRKARPIHRSALGWHGLLEQSRAHGKIQARASGDLLLEEPGGLPPTPQACALTARFVPGHGAICALEPRQRSRLACRATKMVPLI
jgi:hypothetical protein